MLDVIPSAEEREQIHKMLRDIPENDSLYKCHKCKSIFDIYSRGLPIFMALSGKEGVICHNCKSESTEIMCRVDAYSIYLKLSGNIKCRKEELISGADICPVCKSSMCPECGNHNVVSWSRITGYLNDVSGWNNAKKQELLDRKRYEVGKVEVLA